MIYTALYEAQQRIRELEAIQGRLVEWSQAGTALIPRGADTYGHGMLTAKAEVRRIISEAPMIDDTHEFPDLEAQARTLAQTLKEQLPPGLGFGLFVFNHGPAGGLAWLANTRREDMLLALREFLDRMEAGNPRTWPKRN